MCTCLTKKTLNVSCIHVVSADPTVNVAAAVSISIIFLIVFLFLIGVGAVLSVIICRRKSLFDTISFTGY